MTARLDTIQAAVLIEKLKIFPDEIVARDRVAKRYNAALWPMSQSCRKWPTGYTSVWAQYTLRLKPGQRDSARRCAESQGHPDRDLLSDPAAPSGRLQEISRSAEGGLPVTERLADEVISLPMHAYLDELTQDRIIAAVREALGR